MGSEAGTDMGTYLYIAIKFHLIIAMMIRSRIALSLLCAVFFLNSCGFFSGSGPSEVLDELSSYVDLAEEKEEVPESMWIHSSFAGTMTGDGRTYRIELWITYPGTGDVYCDVKGGYRYEGHSDMISLEGDWWDFNMGRIVMLDLHSDRYREHFLLEFDGEDLISTTTLEGTWSKYANEEDYADGSTPTKKLDVNLKEVIPG